MDAVYFSETLVSTSVKIKLYHYTPWRSLGGEEV
jgi:hypothetical protein